MNKMTRSVHPASFPKFGPMSELCPDLTLEAHDNDGNKIDVLGLAFTDPDGECHVYCFDENGKESLIRQLSGGVIMPANGIVIPDSKLQ
jgi:hypothetical protein